MEDILKFIIEKIDLYDSERYIISINCDRNVLSFETEEEYFDINLVKENGLSDVIIGNVILRYLIFEKDKLYTIFIEQGYNMSYIYLIKVDEITENRILTFEESYKTLSK